MKLSRHCFLLIIFSITLYACKKPDDKLSGQQTEAATSNLLSEPPYKLMRPAYYRNAADGKSILVRFYESPRIFELNKSTTNFQESKALIDKARDNKITLRIYIANENAEYVTLQRTEAASEEEIRKTTQNKPAPLDLSGTRTVIPNKKVLDSIFTFCKEQGCATDTWVIDYCIPFQYVVDGCYARAHKMRQIMIKGYKYDCEKVFSYEGSTGSLAVDAGDCCVEWWYHVAPLVTLQTAHGTKKFVIDPSLFDQPVPIDVWTSVQENHTCNSSADFGYYEITPGYVYTPGGGRDDNYAATNQTLRLYANLETCSF